MKQKTNQEDYSLKQKLNEIHNSLRLDIHQSGTITSTTNVNVLTKYGNSFRKYMRSLGIEVVIYKYTYKKSMNGFYSIYESKHDPYLQVFHAVGDTFYWIHTKHKHLLKCKAYNKKKQLEHTKREFYRTFFKL